MGNQYGIAKPSTPVRNRPANECAGLISDFPLRYVAIGADGTKHFFAYLGSQDDQPTTVGEIESCFVQTSGVYIRDGDVILPAEPANG